MYQTQTKQCGLVTEVVVCSYSVLVIKLISPYTHAQHANTHVHLVFAPFESKNIKTYTHIHTKVSSIILGCPLCATSGNPPFGHLV